MCERVRLREILRERKKERETERDRKRGREGNLKENVICKFVLQSCFLVTWEIVNIHFSASGKWA